MVSTLTSCDVNHVPKYTRLSIHFSLDERSCILLLHAEEGEPGIEVKFGCRHQYSKLTGVLSQLLFPCLCHNDYIPQSYQWNHHSVHRSKTLTG